MKHNSYVMKCVCKNGHSPTIRKKLMTAFNDGILQNKTEI